MKIERIKNLDGPELLRSIDDPDGIGGSVSINDEERSVENGNHRIGWAVKRLDDSNYPEITRATQVLALG